MVTYKVSTPTTVIGRTDVKMSVSGTGTVVASSTTARNSTSLEGYSVLTGTPPIVNGSAYLKLTVSFPVGGTLTLYRAVMFLANEA